ncbi:DMT family transporter [Dyella tabacisoli]|uniref:Guanidinium exporter n=1 Tax=Dyella tabacisoli TaxID=2282381 RepID=A0A369UMT5_9GAMM|nr:multidrug efflux SMR transporter [Dyella tabacisoli]RDD81841.1 QacE family quaternary ammonium compound efflux SMR transporter [Dyella tabacisoli]
MSISSAWLMLLVAGALDVLWAVSMKLSQGYTRWGWSAVSLLALAAFVVLLGRALTALPVGSAYAVWTGIGAAGTALLGVVLFGEPLSLSRVAGIVLIVAGVIALRAVTPAA